MNVFINDINLENIALFKAELIIREIEEMDLNDSSKYLVIEEIIKCLGDYDLIWCFDVTLASPTFIFFSFVSFLFCLNVKIPVIIIPNSIIKIIIFFKLSSPFISYYYIHFVLKGFYKYVIIFKGGYLWISKLLWLIL